SSGKSEMQASVGYGEVSRHLPCGIGAGVALNEGYGDLSPIDRVGFSLTSEILSATFRVSLLWCNYDPTRRVGAREWRTFDWCQITRRGIHNESRNRRSKTALWLTGAGGVYEFSRRISANTARQTNIPEGVRRDL